MAASKRQRMMTIVAASMATTSILLNLWGIPRYGIIGAAWATAVSYAIGLILTLFLTNIRDIGMAFWREFPIPLGIAILIGISAKWMGLNLWLACIWECIGFYSGLFLTRILKLSDIDRVIRLVFGKGENEGTSD